MVGEKFLWWRSLNPGRYRQGVASVPSMPPHKSSLVANGSGHLEASSSAMVLSWNSSLSFGETPLIIRLCAFTVVNLS
jgi:hypothetical protein